MSRGDAGGYRGDSSDNDGEDCTQTYDGPINSPKKNALAKVGVGDVLKLKVEVNAGRSILVVETEFKEIAGSLTFTGVLKIIDCIVNKGIDYKATITGISGGSHMVYVEPVV